MDFDIDENLLDALIDIDNTYSTTDNVFLLKAEKEGLINLQQNYQSPLTIFAPLSFVDDDDNDFLSLWRIHTSLTHIQLTNINTVTQIRTQQNLFYSIYAMNSKMYIADVEIVVYNEYKNNYIIHYIRTTLPQIRLLNNGISTLPLLVLSNQEYTIKLRKTCIHDVTLHISFHTFGSRDLISVQKFSNYEKDNITIIPDVSENVSANLWIQLISNTIGIPLVSWIRPQNMTIYSNPLKDKNPQITEFIPQTGCSNQLLWISGYSFSPKSIRVTVGDQFAIVYSCSDTLIKCLLPYHEIGTKCNIQVSNSNVFVTSSKQFVYV